MTDNIDGLFTPISLEAERIAREPHATYQVRCLDCAHEWQAVVHLPAPNKLECPRCEWRETQGDKPYPHDNCSAQEPSDG